MTIKYNIAAIARSSYKIIFAIAAAIVLIAGCWFMLNQPVEPKLPVVEAKDIGPATLVSKAKCPKSRNVAVVKYDHGTVVVISDEQKNVVDIQQYTQQEFDAKSRKTKGCF